MYIQHADEARELLKSFANRCTIIRCNENIGFDSSIPPAEIEELQKRIEAANLELGANTLLEGLNERVQSRFVVVQTRARHENEAAVEETGSTRRRNECESVNIL